MKRILALAGLVLFACASAFAVTVSIPNTNVNPGTTTVQIPVNIDNATGVAGFQFTVTFDNSVLNATGATTGSLTSGWFLQVNTQTAGQISVIGATSSPLTGGSGSLCTLQFNVVGTPASSTNLHFSLSKLSDFNAQQISHTANDGLFHINGYSISGKVTLVGGTGQVTNVVLTLNQVAVKSTTNPNAQGNYSFTDLAPGDYEITPSLNGYAFTPATRNVTVSNANVTGQNFTGNALGSVSGTITYLGTQTGTIHIGLFTSSTFTGQPAYGTTITSPGAYQIQNVAPGTYYAAAFMDVNGSGQWEQATEPSGTYSGNPFTLSAGQNKTGVNITLKEPLTLDVISAHGSPNPSVGQHVYYTGDSVTASVTSPVSGPAGTRYVCTGWTGTGSVPATGSTTSTTFTINQNSTITWNWKTQYQLTYSADPAAGGTVAVSPTATGNWYDENTPITLTATPKTNYVFLYWIVDGQQQGNNPTLNLSMNASHNVVAKFALNQPVLNVNPTSVQFYFNINVDETTKETDITIKNTGSGAGTLNWEINPANIVYQQGTGWITVYQDKNGTISGSLPAGASETVILQVDRSGLQTGVYNATVPVTSNGGNANISVKMIINQSPIAQAISPEDEITVETAVEFNAKFTSFAGTITRSEWNIYDMGMMGKTFPSPLKTIELSGTTNKIVLPIAMFKQGHQYYWTVQCWDSYGEESDTSGEYFSISINEEKLSPTTINPGESSQVTLPDSTTGETALVTLASDEGILRITPLKVSDFPGASSVFANLFDIRVENITAGATALIIFEVPGSYSTWLKYRYDNENQEWTVVSIPSTQDSEGNYAKLSDGNPGYTKVELQLKDGGKYDADGIENGVISDPSGSGATGGIAQVKGGGGGCFIATAAFGSYQEKHVWILRQFRDKYLLTNPIGKAFVKWYYKHSPKYASIIAQNELLRAIVRVALLPLYGIALITLKFSAMFWLLLSAILVSLFIRRKMMKKIMLPLIICGLLLVSSQAFAYDFNLFKPANGEQNFLINHSSQTLKSGSYQFDAFYSFTDEVSKAKISGKTQTLVEDQHLLIMGLAYGINDKLTIGADLPIVISQGTKLPSSIIDVKDNGIGNLTVYGKYKFFGGKDQMGVAIVPFIGFDTGDEKNFVSADSTVLGVKLVVDRNWCNHSFLTLNIGVSHQNKEEIGQIKVSNAILFGLGYTQLLPNEKTYATIEITGRSDNGFFEGGKSVPIEAVGSISHLLGKKTKWYIGLGSSINDGYCTPNFRAFTGIRVGF
ncbi:MAG: cohesin domain-containing protein [Candidatus Omnitrophica bacterium]|nr:cohesin domain-containing protein [Candidatus Omnitrophota bacterium]